MSVDEDVEKSPASGGGAAGAQLTVAIVGRPNVGKSTLFNRLVGKRLALVDDQPGVTRDRREAEAQLYDLDFRLIDTAGLEEAPPDSLAGRMRRQSERAVEEADLVLFLFDARAGVLASDRAFADWLRRLAKPVLLLANKCEGITQEALSAEGFALGLGTPIPISGEHGLGLGDLHEAMLDCLPGRRSAAIAEASDESEEVEGPITLAVLGRPNVGKSTLINRLLGEDRLLTGPEAGITRDSITLPWSYKGRALRLVDTAGMRRRAKIDDPLERLAGADSRRALRYAHVALLLLDAGEALERQDLSIAELAVEEGRALVIGVNKWDRVEDAQALRAEIARKIERSLPRVRGLPIVTLSAQRGRGIDRLMQAIFSAYEVWNRRISTAQLNRFLSGAQQAHPPPAPQGRRIRLKYMTQTKARPPTFALFGNQLGALPESYLRYLENGLRDTFDLPGTPLRIRLRKQANPYDD